MSENLKGWLILPLIFAAVALVFIGIVAAPIVLDVLAVVGAGTLILALLGKIETKG